jgi:hypothetical protein
VEGFSHNIHVEGSRCVLAALRDRTPGRYFHDPHHTFSNGSVGTLHALLVEADGSVLHAQVSYENGVDNVETPGATERCQLRDASYFQACIDALDGTTFADEEAAWACLYGGSTAFEPSPLDWFASCATAEVDCN